MNRRTFLLTLLALAGCGTPSKPWYDEAVEYYRAEWEADGRPTGRRIWTGDSILAQCGANPAIANQGGYYPEFWDNKDNVMRAIGGIQTKELYRTLGRIIAPEKPRELYILSGHHDLDICSGIGDKSLSYRTARAMTYFTAIIIKVRENNPDVKIYLMNLPPLTAGNDQTEIIYFNAELKAFTDRWDDNVIFENRWDEFVGADGHMMPQLAWDPHHPNGPGCKVYFDKYK